MEPNLLSSIKNAVKNWWGYLVIGIIAVALGVFCMFTPFATFAALSVFFVVGFFAGGICQMIFAITNKDRLDNWGWAFTMGVIDFVFGAILLLNMYLAPMLLCYLIAFWILLQSIWAIGMSIDLKSIPNSGWGWFFVLSMLALFVSILLLFQPVVVGLFTAYILSFGFIIYGVSRIYLAVKLRSLHKFFPEEK